MLTAGCARRSVAYVDDARTVTQAAALRIADVTESGALSERRVSEAPALRHQALTDLRSFGERASATSGLITRTFPADSPSVPFYVEEVRFEGRRAVLILEAIGRPGGRLSDERVWVIDRSGDVLLSGVR